MQNPRFEIKYRKEISITRPKLRLKKIILLDALVSLGTQVLIMLLSLLGDLTANHKI
jgi:hypothetical protein